MRAAVTRIAASKFLPASALPVLVFGAEHRP
jgi:hypothetical protein